MRGEVPLIFDWPDHVRRETNCLRKSTSVPLAGYVSGGPSYGTTPRVDLATHAKKRLEVLDSKSPTLWAVRNFQKVIDV